MTYDIVYIHIEDVRPGDTVLYNGELKTVTSQSFGHFEGIGTTLFGDSYYLGTKPVIKVINLKD